ncbi:MAG: hypothetical protein ABJ275_00195 [Maricaulaceae bacterium]
MLVFQNAQAQIDVDSPEFEAFAALKLGYVSGAYTEEHDLLKIIQYHSFYDMPYQAAQILETEIKAGRIKETAKRYMQLSDLYRAARERDLAGLALEKSTALNGGVALKRQKLLGPFNSLQMIREGRCEDIQTSLKQGNQSLTTHSDNYLRLGYCYYEKSAKLDMPSNCGAISKQQVEASAKIDYLDRATRSFAKLSKITPMDKRSYERQGTANKWLRFIGDERKHLIDSCSA